MFFYESISLTLRPHLLSKNFEFNAYAIPWSLPHHSFSCDQLDVCHFAGGHTNGSWPTPAFTDRDGRTIATDSSFTTQTGRREFLYEERDVPHGIIQQANYLDPSGKEKRMHVYLPPGYHDSNATYPVLYLNHGGGDDDARWSQTDRNGGHAHRILDI